MRAVVPLPDEEMERAEMRQQVLNVLRSLPEEYRLPLTLRYIAGADYETIQLQMGLSNGSLRGLLHRGLKMLRAEMQKESGQGSGVSNQQSAVRHQQKNLTTDR